MQRNIFLSVLFFCAAATAHASVLDDCRALLGPFQEMIPHTAFATDARQFLVRRYRGESVARALTRIPYPPLASAARALNTELLAPEERYLLLKKAIKPILKSRGFRSGEEYEGFTNEHKTIKTIIYAPHIDSDDSNDAFRDFIRKLRTWNVDVSLNEVFFLDRITTQASLKALDDTPLALEPPLTQWFSKKLDPATVHEAIHLAFRLQEQSDLRGERTTEKLPGSFIIQRFFVPDSLRQALHAYSESHTVDEFDAFLGDALATKAIIRHSVARGLKTLSDEAWLNLKQHQANANESFEMAHYLRVMDEALFKKAIQALWLGDSSVKLRVQDDFSATLTNEDLWSIHFVPAQAAARFGLKKFDPSILIPYLYEQVDHYEALSPLIEKYSKTVAKAQRSS